MSDNSLKHYKLTRRQITLCLALVRTMLEVPAITETQRSHKAEIEQLEKELSKMLDISSHVQLQ